MSSLLTVTLLGIAQVLLILLILGGLVSCFIPFSKIGIKEGIVGDEVS